MYHCIHVDRLTLQYFLVELIPFNVSFLMLVDETFNSLYPSVLYADTHTNATNGLSMYWVAIN